MRSRAQHCATACCGLVSTAPEREHLAALERVGTGLPWDTVLFTAKEPLYKAWYPLARRWLGFHDAEVTIDRERNSFEVRVVAPGPTVADR